MIGIVELCIIWFLDLMNICLMNIFLMFEGCAELGRGGLRCTEMSDFGHRQS